MEQAVSDASEQPQQSDEAEFITDLIGLSSFIEQQGDLKSRGKLAGMVAQLLRINNCSIMLLKEDGEQTSPKLRVLAHHGFLPEDAYREPAS